MSQNPKAGPKMCKSPKNVNLKTDKIDYESMSTNCTVVGSNNLNLVKKPPVMSPAYSSPSYPPSPYSSPASLKSPSPSLKPPTPQPAFPVMQIIQHNNHQILARPMQGQPQPNIIKLKPHLNILPKPSASPQPSPKPSVSPQIMIPTNQQATIMPSAQPLLLNQMPMLATAQGVQFILKPQTATKIPTATPQGLILQPGGQPLIQIQPPRSQPMVRVLTNSVQIAPQTTTAYVTAMGGLQTISSLNDVQQSVVQQQHVAQHLINQKKPKTKPKSKKKLDLANIMKLSGIGDEDDIQFESDTSQSESEHNPTSTTPQPQHHVQMQHSNMMHAEANKKMQAGIQIQGIQPTINTTPVVQVLNQNFHSGMISNTSQASQAGIPFNPFITPNFTINNGLMVQRTGGFKLTLGEDGRLVLQHDPTLNQDLQSQLILQSVFGLNGLNGLVFQPSIDQQTVQQTVQTIQQQSVQTIQQQTVQSQTIQTVQQQTVPAQTVQHLQPQIQQQTVQQTIQHQTVQSQPAMQIVQPQPIHSMASVQPQVHHSIQSHVHSLQSAQIHGLLQQQQQQISPQQSPQHNQHSQPVLKVQPFQKSQLPVQTVHPQPVQPIQPVHPQPVQAPPVQPIRQDAFENAPAPTSYVVNLTSDQLEQLKRNGQLTVNGQTIFMRPNVAKTCENAGLEKKMSPKIKPVKKVHKIQASRHDVPDSPPAKPLHSPKEPPKPMPKVLPQKNLVQPAAMVQPQPMQHAPKAEPKKVAMKPAPVKSVAHDAGNQDVEKLLGQLLEESGTPAPTPLPPQQGPQMIQMLQITPQKQQHLRQVQMQIQTLSAQMSTGNVEIQDMLKALFAEQHKILATGKLLPPDKVYYHNNQLTIVNPSSLNSPPAPQPHVAKSEPIMPQHPTNGRMHDIPPPTLPQHVARLPVVAPEPPHQPKISDAASMPPPTQLSPQTQYNLIAKKAHLVEAQLSQDQQGAQKPDVNAPFRDKKDACIRLVRYHCLDEPILSEKDLDMADQYYELTAKHFLGKYERMVDKYKYLLLKESMREVKTSELMMLDRMFNNGEEQSLKMLRQEQQQQHDFLDLNLALEPLEHKPTEPEDYDEWACIQRELGCLPSEFEPSPVKAEPKRGEKRPPDSRLETLKRFRVDKHHKKENQHNQVVCSSAGQSFQPRYQPSNLYCDDNEIEGKSIDEQVQSAIDSILNLQQNTQALDLDSILS